MANRSSILAKKTPNGSHEELDRTEKQLNNKKCQVIVKP